MCVYVWSDWGAGLRGPCWGGAGYDEAGGAAEGGEGGAQFHTFSKSNSVEHTTSQPCLSK